MSDVLCLPKRRNVKELRAVLEQVQPGDLVSALFHDTDQGTFRVTGKVFAASGDKTRLVGGIALDRAGNGAPSTALFALEHVPRTDVLTNDCTDLPFPSADLTHVVPTVSVDPADVVQVGFTCRPYGTFQVTGVAVGHVDRAARRSSVSLGSWILSTGPSGERRLGSRAHERAARVANDRTDATTEEAA